jgi:hypothetical protein
VVNGKVLFIAALRFSHPNNGINGTMTRTTESEASMRIKISFDDKIKKGSRGNMRIPLGPDIGVSRQFLLIIPLSLIKYLFEGGTSVFSNLFAISYSR